MEEGEGRRGGGRRNVTDWGIPQDRNVEIVSFSISLLESRREGGKGWGPGLLCIRPFGVGGGGGRGSGASPRGDIESEMRRDRTGR